MRGVPARPGSISSFGPQPSDGQQQGVVGAVLDKVQSAKNAGMSLLLYFGIMKKLIVSVAMNFCEFTNWFQW
jgi:hypothetical protein